MVDVRYSEGVVIRQPIFANRNASQLLFITVEKEQLPWPFRLSRAFVIGNVRSVVNGKLYLRHPHQIFVGRDHGDRRFLIRILLGISAVYQSQLVEL